MDGDDVWDMEELTQEVITFFNEQAHGDDDEEVVQGDAIKPDQRFFKRLAEGASHDKDTLDETILLFAERAKTMEDLDAIMRAILRAATHELRACNTPEKVVLSQYVAIARLFYDDAQA